MSNDRESQIKVPPKLALTAVLTSGITIVISISYIILCIITLIYRFACDTVELDSSNNAQLTWHNIYILYIQNTACNNLNLGDSGVTPQLTKSDTVFLLVILTLCFSVFTLATGAFLTAGVKNNTMSKYMVVIVNAYVISWVGSLTVDLTFAVYLGMDYTTLTQRLLADPLDYNFVIDGLRHGVFVLMSVVLKGYVILALNIVLIGTLVFYTYNYHIIMRKYEQHSIHKEGPLNAFDQPRRTDNNWVKPEPMSPYASPFSRGQTNNAYMNEDDYQLRNLPRSDFYAIPSQSFNRSNSWQHQPPSSHSSRPFSYMEEPRRPVPVKPPVSPSVNSQNQRRREPWQQSPPLPVPDYSPHTPRKLKSALKPAGYM